MLMAARGNMPDGKVVTGASYIPLSRDEAVAELALLSSQETVVTAAANGKFVTVVMDAVPEMYKVMDAFDYPHTATGEEKIYGKFAYLHTLRLDGQGRLSLLSPQPFENLQSQPTNYLNLLFRNNALRARVSQSVHKAVGRFFVIDATSIQTLKVRLSERAPNSEDEEKSFTTAGIAFHGAATPLEETGDGIRAFVGIIASIIAGGPRVILIDEPEAFLHPALAMGLGKEISSSITPDKMRLFASTHSSSFLMGCIQSGAPINIVRLTYKDGAATTRILARDKLLHLMRNPMLRSTGVLEGLFYEAVIVTEADADRAFYQEINERLRSAGDERGIKNCLFINAQNKQTVWDIVAPMRELGIPAIGIVDLDMVKDGGTKTFKSAFIPEMQHQSLNILLTNIKRALNETVDSNDVSTAVSGTVESTGSAEKDPVATFWKRGGGTSRLQGPNRQTANEFFTKLESHGVFVVQNGELESWLGYLGVSTHKRGWLTKMFERMKEDPSDSDYVVPQQGDVWDFIGRIRTWIDDPNRNGIPN